MATNIFQNPTSGVPTHDSQIVRVGMQQLDIGGRKSNLPANSKSDDLSIQHVATRGS